MLSSVKANEARYYFTCSNFEPQTFEVVHFSGVDRISYPYLFSITLLSHNHLITMDEVFGAASTLYFLREGHYYPYSGIISKFQIIEQNANYSTYVACLVPHLWFTTLNIQTRIYQKMTVIEIIKKVLCDAELISYVEFMIDEKNAARYPKLEYVVQYKESDLNFISRQMECYGLWYFFREGSVSKELIGSYGSVEKVIITDSSSSFSDVEAPDRIVFSSPSGLVEEYGSDEFESVKNLYHIESVIPKDVVVKNYNYRTPESAIVANVSDKGAIKGKVYEYGGSCKNTTEANTAAELILRGLKTRQTYTNGSGDCSAFRAGYRFELEKHFCDELNTSHLIVNVYHSGGHFETDSSQTYSNQFETIFGDSVLNYAPQRYSTIPRVTGILTAQIEADGSSYAALDTQGRYKVRFPFDTSDNRNDCTGSKYIRLAQPYSGAQYGFHFPSHEGTEMVLACIDGDPNKPLGIGTVPNANTISPVNDLNRHQNVIKTAGGNALIMDDQDGRQKIQLGTIGLQSLQMDDEKRKVVLTTSEHNQIILDDQNKLISFKNAGNTITMSCKDDSNCIELCSTNGHIIKIDDDKKIITVKSSGGNRIDIDDDAMNIVLSDGENTNTVTLDGKSGLSIQSSGNISFNSQQDVEIIGANVKISSAKGDVDIMATDTLAIKGNNIDQNSNSSINISGTQIETVGTVAVAIKGGNVEIESEGMVKVSGGTAAELCAGISTTVKGGIVNIN